MGNFFGQRNEKLIVKWLLWLGGISLIFYSTVFIKFLNSLGHFLFFTPARDIGILLISFAILIHYTWDIQSLEKRFLKWFLWFSGLTLLFFDSSLLINLDKLLNFYFLKPSTYLGVGMIYFAIRIQTKWK